MKVILLQDVKGQGKKGQAINVSDGHARNFLLPRKLAVEANSGNMNELRQQERAKERKLSKEIAAASATKEKLEGILVKITAKAGSGGRLFGAVTSREISDVLKKHHDISIEKNKIMVYEPIKSFGSYDIKCKLGHEITGVINLLVTE